MKPEPIIIKNWQVYTAAVLFTLTVGAIFVVMTLQPMLALAHDIHQLRLETDVDMAAWRASRAKHNAFMLEAAQIVAAATQRLTASTPLPTRCRSPPTKGRNPL